jgi:hypothetical protein
MLIDMLKDAAKTGSKNAKNGVRLGLASQPVAPRNELRVD